MGKDTMMGQEFWLKDFCVESNSILKLENYKMLRKLWSFCENSCLLDLNHHILAQWNLSIELFGMWKLGMLIGIHFSSFVILSRGLWKFIQFVPLKRIIWHTYLWKIRCVFVSSVWTNARLSAKMSKGQANGCQNNFNLKILTMCGKQCMKVWMEIGNMGYKVCLQTHYCSCNYGLLAWFLLFHSFLFVIVFIILIYGHAGDELTVVLGVGDNFRVNAKERNDEGVTFWVILCIEPLHKVKVPFIDNWEVCIITNGEMVTILMSYFKIHIKSMSTFI